MKSENIRKIVISIFILLSIFFLDRISKILILNILAEAGRVDIYINSFLNFYLVWNKGIGFGLLSSDQDLFYNVVTTLIILINFVIIYLLFKEKGLKYYFLIIILGGSLGNLFDRIYYRAVPDFFDLNYNGFHWFVFNVADIFITIGIITSFSRIGNFMLLITIFLYLISIILSKKDNFKSFRNIILCFIRKICIFLVKGKSILKFPKL